MERLLRVAELRDLESRVSKGEISYSRMVEIINEKHFLKLVELRQELKVNELSKPAVRQSLPDHYDIRNKAIELSKECLSRHDQIVCENNMMKLVEWIKNGNVA